MLYKYNYLKGVPLITGTCIGAGMIGLPVKTASAGFYLTIITLIIVWGIMTYSALLLSEVSLFFPGKNNFISMSNAIFGRIGKNIAWFVCLMFLYSIMGAFAAGGASMLSRVFLIDHKIAIFLFMLPFFIVIYLGTSVVAIVNRALTVGIILFFILLCASIFMTAEKLQPFTNFNHNCDFKSLLMALPLIVTTFSYHEIIPSVKSYLSDKVTPLKIAILLGGFIPLVIYIIWEIIILLLVPINGKEGLVSMLLANNNPGDSLVKYLLDHHDNANILFFMVSFSFCALTSSFTGTAWALCDFFADGLCTKNRSLLSILTFVPPIIYVILFPQGFLKALGFAGAFSAVIMIVYPCMMAYKIRNDVNYHKNIKYRAPINKLLIGGIFMFGVFIVILEVLSNFSQ